MSGEPAEGRKIFKVCVVILICLSPLAARAVAEGICAGWLYTLLGDGAALYTSISLTVPLGVGYVLDGTAPSKRVPFLCLAMVPLVTVLLAWALTLCAAYGRVGNEDGALLTKEVFNWISIVCFLVAIAYWAGFEDYAAAASLPKRREMAVFRIIRG